MENTIYTVAPLESHTFTIILLHGRDSVASEFASEFFESQTSDDRTLTEIFPAAKWVFPTSKMRHSARFEQEMSQWFDMWSVDNPSERENIQIEGLAESVTQILEVIQEETKVVPLDRIILGGLSQGCATAIFALMCAGVKLGGFMGLCSWLPLRNRISQIPSTSSYNDVSKLFRSMLNISMKPGFLPVSEGSAIKTPVFLSHSQDDNIVPIYNGRGLKEGLEALDFNVTWREYEEGGHWVNEPQGVDDMVTFLQQIIGT